MVSDSGWLTTIFVFLLLSLVTVPIAKRAGFGASVGYLLAGIVIGPWGLAVIRDTATIALSVEFSTILLLFVIALQASPERIRMLAKDFFSISLLHLMLTLLLVFIISMLIGLPWHHSVIAGLALALSSSALANQAFRERYPAGSTLTDKGRRLLLSQNLAVVPILVFVPLLGFDAAVTHGSAWPLFFRSCVIVIAFALASHYLLSPLFRYVASIGLEEVFAAFALVMVIGTLLLMQSFGVPMELGALLAGLLLTRSEYGSAINVAMRPFRELIYGLFFISVGMTVSLGTFIGKPLEMLALVIVLVGVKTLVLRNILRYSSVPKRQRIWLATVLSQSGELAFIIIAFSLTHHAITDKLSSELMVIVALSMLATPLLLRMADKRDLVSASEQQENDNAGLDASSTQVIVAGFGRIGRVVARLLKSNGYRVTVIDHNPEFFSDLRKEGFFGFYGDVLRPDLLEAAGIDHAAVMVLAIDDTERAEQLVRRVRRQYPSMTIVSRAIDSSDKSVLLESGADRAYPETFETALLMGEDVLELVGASPLDAQTMTEAFRDANDEADITK